MLLLLPNLHHFIIGRAGNGHIVQCQMNVAEKLILNKSGASCGHWKVQLVKNTFDLAALTTPATCQPGLDFYGVPHLKLTAHNMLMAYYPTQGQVLDP